MDLDEALATQCTSLVASNEYLEPNQELCTVALQTSDGEARATCTYSPIVANFANYLHEPVVMEGWQVSWAMAVKKWLLFLALSQ